MRLHQRAVRLGIHRQVERRAPVPQPAQIGVGQQDVHGEVLRREIPADAGVVGHQPGALVVTVLPHAGQRVLQRLCRRQHRQRIERQQRVLQRGRQAHQVGQRVGRFEYEIGVAAVELLRRLDGLAQALDHVGARRAGRGRVQFGQQRIRQIIHALGDFVHARQLHHAARGGVVALVREHLVVGLGEPLRQHLRRPRPMQAQPLEDARVALAGGEEVVVRVADCELGMRSDGVHQLHRHVEAIVEMDDRELRHAGVVCHLQRMADAPGGQGHVVGRQDGCAHRQDWGTHWQDGSAHRQHRGARLWRRDLPNDGFLAQVGQVLLRQLAAIDLGQVAGTVAFERQHHRRRRVRCVGLLQQPGQGVRRGHVLLPARGGARALGLARFNLHQHRVFLHTVDQRHNVRALRGHVDQRHVQRVLRQVGRGAIGEAAEHLVGSERGIDDQQHAVGGGRVGGLVGERGQGHGFSSKLWVGRAGRIAKLRYGWSH